MRIMENGRFSICTIFSVIYSLFRANNINATSHVICYYVCVLLLKTGLRTTTNFVFFDRQFYVYFLCAIQYNNVATRSHIVYERFIVTTDELYILLSYWSHYSVQYSKNNHFYDFNRILYTADIYYDYYYWRICKWTCSVY